MSEDVRTGMATSVVVVAMLLIGGASLTSALVWAGIAFFAGAIVGWGLARLFPQRQRFKVLRGDPTWLDRADRGR